MTVRDVIEISVGMATLLVLVLVFQYVRGERAQDVAATTSPPATCAQLHALARTSADSLYVAMNRGDCAGSGR